MTARRLPAYGRMLLTALKAGREPLHGISVWIDTRPPERGLCAPLSIFVDADPANLDWSVCEGRSIIVPHADQVAHDRLISTVREIRAARPLRLLLLKDNPPGIEFVVVGGAA